MQKVKPIQKAVAGGAMGGVSVAPFALVVITVLAKNYDIDIDPAEAALLASAAVILWGFIQGWVVWRVPNVDKLTDKATQE